jgi:hypothetical protein
MKGSVACKGGAGTVLRARRGVEGPKRLTVSPSRAPQGKNADGGAGRANGALRVAMVSPFPALALLRIRLEG